MPRFLLLTLGLASACTPGDTPDVRHADTDAIVDPTTDPSAAPPPGWQGVGVLAARTEELPSGAPTWAAVLAEVVDKDGARFLVASGHAHRIKNPALAKTTAEARARAELARWTKSHKLVGSTVAESLVDPASGDAFAKVELPVPATWTPGQPL